MQKEQAPVYTLENKNFDLTTWLRPLALITVLVGIGISGYLSYVQIVDVDIVCAAGSSFDCGVVQNSIYAKLFGIPVGFLGFASYLVIGGLLLLEDRLPIDASTVKLITFGIVLIGWVFSMWLVYVQGSILEAWCNWCLAHEVNFTVLFGIISLRLRNSLFAS